MTIMGNEPDTAKPLEEAKTHKEQTAEPAVKKEVKNEDKGIFSDSNLPNDSEVDTGKVEEDVSLSPKIKSVTITAAEKIEFIDSVVNNTRFMKEYSLFGGHLKLTLRSMTVDEVNALGSWTAKQGTEDPAGLMSGRYRKYLAAAMVKKYNSVEMPPLENPLFPTLESDGKTVKEPGWLNRSDFWDRIGIGAFNALMTCISDFDLRYSTLCKEAENANFWNPDTP
jgi:hypothetical protein